MVKKVIWSRQAQNDRFRILEYWIEHNQSTTYSIKLNRLFQNAIKLIAKYPGIGRPTDLSNVRGKVVRDYYIYYEVQDDELHILAIWDTRQDPESMKAKIKRGRQG